MTQSKTAGARGPIADALIGVWTLRRYSDVTDGLPLHHPFGDDPEGLLIYTANGFVSAVLTARGRPNLSGNGFTDGTPAEYTAAGTGFIGYSGKYEVDEDRSVVTHRPHVAFAPNMVGKIQPRFVEFEGDVLVLTAEHAQSAGVPASKSRLEWARVAVESKDAK